MNRVFTLALLLAGGAFTAEPAVADEPTPPAPGAPAPEAVPEPAPDPVDATQWTARDTEGRWALYRANGDPSPGPFASPWIPFLERHGDWQILEWLAFSTNSSQAAEALATSKQPTWMRAAVWCLNAADSHQRGAAENAIRARADLARGWFALHPPPPGSKALLLAAQLLAESTTQDQAGAAALAPPYDPEVLLAALVPPSSVVEFGARTHAEPGVTYVHQVERALAILAHSRLEGETWDLRLATLIAHPHAGVRRGAALATASRPSQGLPLEALLARLDAADEQPAVRSAALLALSASARPDVRLRVLAIALDPRHPSLTAAASRLADVDDGFLLEAWAGLDLSAGDPERKTFLDAQAQRLSARLATRDAEQLASRLPLMLALAAHVDLGCHPLEGTLVSWTLRTVAAASSSPFVRASLEKIGSAFDAATFAPGVPDAPALTERVRSYAAELLRGEAGKAR